MNLLVVGDDKICRAFLRDNPPGSNIVVVVDRSTSSTRVLKLLRSGALSIPLVLRMIWADWQRADAPPSTGQAIHSHADLLEIVRATQPAAIVLFRAGLIIRKSLIGLGIPIKNVHAARLPEYGGIGTIWRALKDGAYDQCATLHIVTEKIDSGEILDTEPYSLDPTQSYLKNENAAYAAGSRLLVRTLKNETTAQPAV